METQKGVGGAREQMGIYETSC